MGPVLPVLVFLACAALALASTMLAGPILSGRFGRHSLWIAPLIAIPVVIVAIMGYGLFVTTTISGHDYLGQSLTLGMTVAPFVGVVALLSALVGLRVRADAKRVR